MSSRNSSLSRTPPRGVAKSSSGLGFGSDGFRYEILEPNNILLEDGIMGSERWSDLAFSLGLPARQGQRVNPETQRLAQKMKKRKVVSGSQTFDMIRPFVESVTSTCPKVSQQTRCVYHADAIPSDESLRNTIHRLPTPRPAISLGYYRDAFSAHHDELQNGIIMGPQGEPCDLNHISQPIMDHFWPFFVVEISDHSMTAARHASAVSAATCSNALHILSGAVEGDVPQGYSSPFMFDPKHAKSFSLSISGKIALLSAHSAEGLAPFVATPIASYKLDEEHDVAALADRIHSILVWAQYNRLGEIGAALDALDKKVHGSLAGASQNQLYDFDPHCLKSLKLQPPRRPDRIRVALKAGLPRWMAKA